MMNSVQEGVRRAFRRFDADDKRVEPFVAEAMSKILIEQGANFAAETLRELLVSSGARQSVIVGEAAHYRAEATTDTDPAVRIAEDIWCRHLRSVMLIAEETARKTGSHIILDIGEYLPASEANIELLKSAGDVGLCGVSQSQSLTPEEVVAKVTAIYEHVEAGHLGKAIAAIDQDDTLSEDRKWLMRLVAFEKGGAHVEAGKILDGASDILGRLGASELVGIAGIAVCLEREALAQALVERAMPELLSERDLENALQVAIDSRRSSFVLRVIAALRSLHPNSQLLRTVDGREAGRSGDYERAAKLLGGSASPEQREVGRVFKLLHDVMSSGGLNEAMATAHDLVAGEPRWGPAILKEVLKALERQGRRDEGIEMLFAGLVPVTEDWFAFARGIVERSLASGSAAMTEQKFELLLDTATTFLSEHPDSSSVRVDVSAILDVERLGVGGVGLLAVSALNYADELADIVDDGTKPTPRLYDMDRMPTIIGRVVRWLADAGDGVLVLGRDTIDREALNEDPDAVLGEILKLVDYHAVEGHDPAEELVMKNYVAVALAIAPIAQDRNADIAILRGAAVKMQLGGNSQFARDIAEQILLDAGPDAARRRLSLAAVADIYGRLGRLREAFLLLIAAFKLPSSQSWDEAWSEQVVLFRLLRDIGLMGPALAVSGRLRQVAATAGQAEHYGSRLDTMELNVQLALDAPAGVEPEITKYLIDSATSNAEAVVKTGDEALPAAIMLQQMVERAEGHGIQVSDRSRKALADLTEFLPVPYQQLVAATARLPDAENVVTVVKSVQPARYNEDAGYDFRFARGVGTRLARAAVAAASAEDFFYSVELLGAREVGSKPVGEGTQAATNLLDHINGPLATTRVIARKGVPVVGMALDTTGLMMCTVTAGDEGIPVAVSKSIFDRKSLAEWSEAYPYRYAEAGLSAEELIAATAMLGAPSLPDSAIIVSGDLSRLPPNMLTVSGTLAGASRSLATVPSLSWLSSSMSSARQGDGSAAAWIPIAAGAHYMDPLSLLAGDIEQVLTDRSIFLHTQASTPSALGSADLVIVGAHGGLAEDNGFFRGLSDDSHEPLEFAQLVDAVRHSRVALLFVCSGGRFDRHPESGALAGLAHKLLDLGLDAVVAPSWPIPFTVARPWLKAFLTSWNDGLPIMECYRVGNDAVAQETSHDFSRSLAMALYGNPFIKR
jgi:hypothetical protein